VGQDRADWQNRGQFLGVAAQMMRRILVDYARARDTGKRAGNAVKLEFEGFELATDAPQMEEIVAVDEVLSRLAEFDPQQARVVELRYFAGLTFEETAEALGLSLRTVKREWAMASAWLRGELTRAHV
jgi:RNA polymerase sigma factor (TIGR02999 family)